jgi:predicted SAM-dependent methyltransferase
MRKEVVEKVKKVSAYRRSRPIVKKLLQRDVVKLNVGCGTDYKEGWINIDNNSDDNIQKLDLNWDLRYPLPFPEESVDFIFNEHFLEHLTVEEGLRANRDFLRVLKKGGILRVATPDLESVVDRYLHVPLSEDTIIRDFNYTNIKTPAEWMNMSFSFWGHRWLYDWEEIVRRLNEAGFTKVKRCKISKSSYSELRNLETRVGTSLIVEAQK